MDKTQNKAELFTAFEKLSFTLKRMSDNDIFDPQIIQKIKTLCKKHPEILEVQNEEYHQNLGMLGVRYRLQWFVSIALDNEIASIQQDFNGRNIGMYAADYGYEDIVLKALDNKQASVQQNRWKMNIGMTSALSGLETATLKALDNPEASIQQDEYGLNIGMYAVLQGMEKATLKALKNSKARAQINNQNETIVSLAKKSNIANAVNIFLLQEEIEEDIDDIDKSLNKNK